MRAALESSDNTVKPRREAGNYTEERATLLPDLSIEELAAEVKRI